MSRRLWTALAVGVALVSVGCGGPGNVSVASGNDAASAAWNQGAGTTDSGERRVQDFDEGSKLLECDFDVVQGYVLEYRLSTPRDVNTVDVSVSVSPTFRVRRARLEVGVSLGPSGGPFMRLRPKETVLRSRRTTTTTLRFIGNVDARGAKYDVRVGLHPRCRMAAGRAELKKVVTVIEARAPTR